MIGFATIPQVAAAVVAGIEAAQTSRGLDVYWTLRPIPIATGPHAGKVFLPFDDAAASQNLRGGNTPMDFPESAQMLAALGGMASRVDIDPVDILATLTVTDMP